MHSPAISPTRSAVPSFGIYVMELRDPDNIQIALTAPYS